MNIQSHVNLQQFNSFGLPVSARYFYELTHENDLFEIIKSSAYQQENTLWLGGGSNILFIADYPYLVVHLKNKGIEKVGEASDSTLVEVAAGEIWHQFVQTSIENSWYGLENLSLIPGTVGAAPVQNIGAYGVEVKSCIDAVYCFDLETATFIWIDNQECQFAYRESLFKHQGKHRYVIIKVRFKLAKLFTPQIQYGDIAKHLHELNAQEPISAKMVSHVVCEIRQQKLPDPKILGNVGSFFKNPIIPSDDAKKLLSIYPHMPHYPMNDEKVKLAAGWLIDQCGLKGYQIGGAAVHQHQALVLVNKDNATASDVVALAKYIQQKVATKFNVQLMIEPNWLPE